jgi:hypothetical protein
MNETRILARRPRIFLEKEEEIGLMQIAVFCGKSRADGVVTFRATVLRECLGRLPEGVGLPNGPR